MIVTSDRRFSTSIDPTTRHPRIHSRGQAACSTTFIANDVAKMGAKGLL